MPPAPDTTALYAAAIARHRAGDLAAARELYRRVVAAEPGHFDALHGLGVTAALLGEFGEGLARLQQAVAARPEAAAALEDFGRLLEDLGRPDLAVAPLERAVAAESGRVDSWLALARCRLATQRRDEALAASRQALALAPGSLRARCNLTMCLLRTGRLDEAETVARAALDLDPGATVALNNLGAVRRERGDLTGAEDLFRRAIAAAPGFAAAHLNLGLTLFLQGRWREGWPEYEWRLKEPGGRVDRGFARPQWQGEPLAGRTLLVHAEQGHGDTVQFARYVLPLARLDGRVVLEVQPGLKGLLASAPGVAAVLARGERLPPFDLHIPLPALPRVFGTTPDTIPSPAAYIFAAPGRAAAWAALLPPEPGRRRVGLAWAGSPSHGDDHNRSIPLELLRPLLRRPEAHFFSLQVGRRGGDSARLGLDGWITDLGPRLADYNETAAALANLDLVIAVDTSVAHLAGAMGRPTWLLLPAIPDWRWLMAGESTRWYPSMRLFRRDLGGGWPEVVERLAAALAEAPAVTG